MWTQPCHTQYLSTEAKSLWHTFLYIFFVLFFLLSHKILFFKFFFLFPIFFVIVIVFICCLVLQLPHIILLYRFRFWCCLLTALLLNVVGKRKKKGLNFSRKKQKKKKNAKRIIETRGEKKNRNNLQLMPLISWLLSTNVAYQALQEERKSYCRLFSFFLSFSLLCFTFFLFLFTLFCCGNFNKRIARQDKKKVDNV